MELRNLGPRSGGWRVPAGALEQHAEYAATARGLDLERASKLLAKSPNQLVTHACAINAAVAETDAVILDAEAEEIADRLQAYADDAMTAVGKCVLDGVGDELVDDQAHRDGLRHRQAAADGAAHKRNRLPGRDQH